MGATEARIHFGELMRLVVAEQEPILIERSGEPHVVILSIAQYERLKSAQEPQTNWQERVERARQQVAADLGGRTLPPAEKIIRHLREERDGKSGRQS